MAYTCTMPRMGATSGMPRGTQAHLDPVEGRTLLRTLRTGFWKEVPNSIYMAIPIEDYAMNFRKDCNCFCHYRQGVLHFDECCGPDEVYDLSSVLTAPCLDCNAPVGHLCHDRTEIESTQVVIFNLRPDSAHYDRVQLWKHMKFVNQPRA